MITSYIDIMLRYIKKNVTLDINNNDDKYILFSSLIELGFQDEVISNPTIFSEIFNIFNRLRKGSKIECTFNKNTLNILTILNSGEYDKLNIIIVDNIPIITYETIKQGTLESTTIKYEFDKNQEIKKTKNSESHDFISEHYCPTSKFKNSIHFINELGIVIYENTKLTVKNGRENQNGLNTYEIIKQRDEKNPLIKYEKQLDNSLVTYGSYPDLGEITLTEPNEHLLRETEEEAINLIDEYAKQLENNIEKILEENNDVRIKEYYINRYKDYPELINKYTLSKV